MRIVLLGAPGAGKGTQAEALAAYWKIVHISTGDLFRYHRDHGTALGIMANEFMAQGQLVPDGVTQAMVEERIGHADAGNGFVLDGFPRTLPQGQALAAMLQARHEKLDAALYIEVPESVLMDRLVGRRICPECKANYHVAFHPPRVAGVCDQCGAVLVQRDDDLPQTVQTRLAVYKEQTAPLIAFYQGVGLLRTINGNQSPSEVTLAAVAALGGTHD